MSDLSAELITGAKRGNSDAIDELLGKIRKPLFHYACHYLGSDFEAEDITQEVLCKVVKALPSFMGDSTIWTWLFKIMTNACIDYQRKRTVRPVVYLSKILGNAEEAVTLELPDQQPLPDEAVELLELRQMIRDALNQLSPEHRAIIILHDINNFKYQEIAKITKTGLGTVKSRLFYARQELRKILGPVLIENNGGE